MLPAWRKAAVGFKRCANNDAFRSTSQVFSYFFNSDLRLMRMGWRNKMP